MQNKDQRLTRWGLKLQEYNLIIKHIKAKDNVISWCFVQSWIWLLWIYIEIYCKKFVSKLFLQEGRCYVYVINLMYYFVYVLYYQLY